MNAKKQALLDIREDLKKEGKCFIAFHKELNYKIKKLTHIYLKKQKDI